MAADRILEGLNEAQRRAVTHNTRPLRIVGRARNRKTTGNTRRIARLTSTRRARPGEVLAPTLTGKAAPPVEEDGSPEESLAHAGRFEREAAAAVGYEEARERAAQQRELAATYAKYEELMTRDGCVDFGDQIVQVLRLFRRRPYVLGAYQRRFR